MVGIATDYGLDGPGIESRCEARFSALVQTGPVAHPTSCIVGTGSFPGVNSGRSVTLTLHPLLVPWSRKIRAVPLFPLRAVRPVRSLSSCTRVRFTCTATLRGYLYTFMIRYSLVFLRMRNTREKNSYRKSKHTFYGQ